MLTASATRPGTSILFAVILICTLGILVAVANSSAPKPKIDQVIVAKHDRTLTLLSQGKAIRTYKISLGGSPVGPKQQEGDHKTPEGRYILDRRNPKSKFYRAIHISYPNQEDRKQAAQRHVSPGGDIMLHGLPNGFGWLDATHLAVDWTDGCIAVTNREMDEIWDLVPDGTPIEIKP